MVKHPLLLQLALATLALVLVTARPTCIVRKMCLQVLVAGHRMVALIGRQPRKASAHPFALPFPITPIQSLAKPVNFAMSTTLPLSPVNQQRTAFIISANPRQQQPVHRHRFVHQVRRAPAKQVKPALLAPMATLIVSQLKLLVQLSVPIALVLLV